MAGGATGRQQSTGKRGAAARVRLKRAYAAPEATDGVRILVDRLWPRGLRKADATIDRWLKELAPSTELRRWFGHDPQRWRGFQQRYRKELAARADLLAELRTAARREPITLLFAARDETHNEAVVLAELLQRRSRSPR